MTTEALIKSGTILEGDAGQIARINRMLTLLGDIKSGIQTGVDREPMRHDAFKVWQEARELAGELSK